MRAQKTGWFEILSVEDNPADADLLTFLFSSGAVPCHLTFVHDGVRASDYLFGRGNYANRPTPDLIFMDLNLPKRDGRLLLREIKKDHDLRKIPVIVLSTSNSEMDIVESYDLGANAFITKPVELHDFEAFIKSVQTFWLQVANLPPSTKSFTRRFV